MKITRIYILLIAALVLLMSSCVDEDLYVDNGHIQEGETELSASLSFPSFFPALERTRAVGGSPGTAISDIESLYILIYEKKEITNEDGPGTTVWKLEEGGRILLNETDHSLKVTNPGSDRPDKDSPVETETAYATFRFKHKNGTYKIYAVANVDLSPEAVPDKDIETPEKLKAFNLKWHTGTGDVARNNGMFGYFTNDENVPVTDTETVNVAPNQRMHAWIRRAASKVTIAYNGSGLADGVEIYILAASLKDIPVKCPLGTANEPDAENSLIPLGGSIKYYKNDVNAPDPGELILGQYEACVTNDHPKFGSDHSVGADALFFYENMQGKGKSKAQTAPGPGNGNGGNGNAIGFPDPDKDTPGSGWKDDKPFGTYIEVDAYYRSTNEDRPGSGIIKYRFMLGKDTDTDYNAERNHHYKLTLNFKGYANDYDWHIDYDPGQAFEVSQPKVYNYMGNVFMPDYFWPNGMHDFVPENPITVTSYVGDKADPKIMFNPVTVDMTFDDSSSPWLDYSVEPGLVPYQKNFVFKVKPEALNVDGKYVKKFNVNSLLASATPKGTEDNPVNLADLERRQIDSYAGITCTANCYMVDAPGWYILPLVYGNAVHNGAVIESSYKPSQGSTQEDILPVFRNYRNEDISSAYIEKDLNISTVTPFLVWQDVDELIEYGSYWDVQNHKITYVPNAFYDDKGKKTVGGVKFHIANARQGNSVIAVGDPLPSGGAVLLNLPDAYWSWHIWVTCLDKQLDDKDKTIEVQGHDSQRHFNFMPVNLGWCSGENEDIVYYKERRCAVKFTFTGNDGQKKTETREIVKKSHIALTRGYNPYYQWGRKDPFAPALAPMDYEGDWANKETWIAKGYSFGTQNPYPMTTFVDKWGGTHDGKLVERVDTRDALHYRIKYPYLWHNPPREALSDGSGFVSVNKTYVNLWEGRPGVDPDAPILKTVYDPSPVGYQVPHINAFSGFTTTGLDTSIESEWYDVRSANIRHYNPEAFGGGPYVYESYEFYTTPDKTQSIIFPINGYRDWDGNGPVYQYGLIGYAWAAGNLTQGDRKFFNFEFAHDDKNTIGNDRSYIRTKNMFYSCDGFPVRPVRNGDHGTK